MMTRKIDAKAKRIAPGLAGRIFGDQSLVHSKDRRSGRLTETSASSRAASTT